MRALLSNGKSTQEKLEEERQQSNEHITNINAAADADVDADYVQMMVDTSLQPGTAKMLANMLSRDWVLANMSEAEVHEARWLARTIIDEVVAMHPPEDSIWTGRTREYASDDSANRLQPLSSAQKTEMFQFVQAYISARITRSKDGFQQETFRKQIRQSQREDLTDDDDGGWL